MRRNRAEAIADEHVQRLGRPADGYRLGRGNIVKVENGWYFDYKIICDLGLPDDQQKRFAGACGFLIEATGRLTDISHAEWVDLGLAFHPYPYGSEEDSHGT